MAGKYPSIPFTMEEVFNAWELLEEGLCEIQVWMRPAPTKAAPGRLLVMLVGFRRSVFNTAGQRYERKRYIEPGKPASLDREVYHLCLDALRELEIETPDFGKFTPLFPNWPPASK